MKYRQHTLQTRTNYTADATKSIDLKGLDPISEIVLDFAATHGAAGSMAAHPVAALTKIEVVDGSDVLWSLRGHQAEALDWYSHKGFRSNYNYALNGGDTQRFIGINFGRYLGDPDYAFDPRKFKNPQLQFTLDIDAGGISVATVKVGAWAHMFDQLGISPRGWLMAKEIKRYPMAASADETSRLPKDYPYRSMLIRQQTLGTEPNQLLATIKLSENGDKRIPYNHGTEAILRTLMADYPEVREDWFFAIASSNRHLMCAPTTRVTAWATVWATAVANLQPALYDGDGGRLKTIGNTSESNCMVGVHGWLPHGCWLIPFGNPMVPEDWYDPTAVETLDAILTAASGAAATDFVELCLEQARHY